MPLLSVSDNPPPPTVNQQATFLILPLEAKKNELMWPDPSFWFTVPPLLRPFIYIHLKLGDYAVLVVYLFKLAP